MSLPGWNVLLEAAYFVFSPSRFRRQSFLESMDFLFGYCRFAHADNERIQSILSTLGLKVLQNKTFDPLKKAACMVGNASTAILHQLDQDTL
jgi:hypothetical protein